MKERSIARENNFPIMQIKSLSMKFSSVYLSGKFDELSNFFTTDAIILTAAGKRIEGKKNIKKHFDKPPGYRQLVHELIPERIFINENLAYENGSWRSQWEEKKLVSMMHAGRYFLVWKKQKDDSWKICFDSWIEATLYEQ